MANKPSTPKGTRDFGPQEMLRRKWIFSTIEKVFQKYGFLPLETPAMENLETLTGKYGEEGDRLIFKILNSGDAWKEVDPNVKEMIRRDEAVPPGRLASELSEKALRYDLTVPFARYVVQHQHELTFPFKRYQIQPVWRADRPQKGRYREFYQCDADVIGSTNLLNEVELVEVAVETFRKLGVPVAIHINSRKILAGFAEIAGQPELLAAMSTAVDKLEKIGMEKVAEELRAAGVNEEGIKMLAEMRSAGGPSGRNWKEDLKPSLLQLFDRSEIGQQGVAEIDFLVGSRPWMPGSFLIVDPTLARGLNYYTGLILEAKSIDGSLESSICGGGRYDNLTGVFGLEGMSGVGISFGADRIYDVLLELDRFPKDLVTSTRLLFVNFGEKEAMHCLQLLRTVRDAGISAELYPDTGAKMKKQMSYADAKGIPFVALIGENEMKQGIVTVKDMKTGEQRAVKEDELVRMMNTE